MKKALMMLALAVAFVPVGSASTMCTGLVITTAGGVPSSCNAGIFTFSNFRIANPSGFAAGNLEIQISNVSIQNNGQDVYLGFGVNHPSLTGSTGDMILIYEMSTNGNLINGVNIEMGTANDIRITENACSTPHAGAFGTSCLTPPLLASFNVASPEGPFVNAGFFAPTNFVSIAKDIQFRSANSSISDFVNSHHAVPEPGTMLLMGSALLGLAALRRRKQQQS
jgi:hypothetical protein